MIVVSDTTPLSELAKVGRIELLHDVFRKIVIPQEVYSELTTGKHPAVDIVRSLQWLEVQAVSDPQKVFDFAMETRLGLGECAAILLAEELLADQILIDDLEARQVAKFRCLPVIGTVGTLLLAKERGFVPSVKEILDELISQGKRISQQLYQDVLTIAKEEF
ncbi:MAG: DUF3368 domain-containing protein [Leptolyngbyaceae cyanobacterium RM2_2_4]|nr:DUF3368 domain-containing protein [Leptolyngbyaceae cyanobacterium SM1_4_3]NJN90117.1 DUF3368 domain-containing protein [Leptolyngbyaceae cyanobacterium SL_5_14]NJO52302.1 DUF3368 domain-containing protein [Leptolyngbyaceae cyanobacterium RM2_2_4]